MTEIPGHVGLPVVVGLEDVTRVFQLPHLLRPNGSNPLGANRQTNGSATTGGPCANLLLTKEKRPILEASLLEETCGPNWTKI